MKRMIKQLIKEHQKRKTELIENFDNERFDCKSDRAVFEKRLTMNLNMIDSFINGLITATKIYELGDAVVGEGVA